MERWIAGNRFPETHGATAGMPRGSSVTNVDVLIGKEPAVLGEWPGESGGIGGMGDWRFGLMRDLRGFMAFVAECEAGAAPSARQRASCVQRLDVLSMALRDNGRNEEGEVRIGVAPTGGGGSVMLRPREIEALGWRHKGLLPKEIAREMGITLLTARSYIRDAASKLDASGWEAAVRRAIELGLL